MTYRPSSEPEDYPSRTVYKGINIYNTIPNRFPYMYDQQPYPSLYYDNTIPNGYPKNFPGETSRITPKVWPYTNRPTPDYTIYTAPQYYESLLVDRNLIPSYTFYKSNCFQF